VKHIEQSNKLVAESLTDAIPNAYRRWRQRSRPASAPCSIRADSLSLGFVGRLLDRSLPAERLLLRPKTRAGNVGLEAIGDNMKGVVLRADDLLFVTVWRMPRGTLIGFSFSMTIARYDQRKALEEAEANAIGSEYLRADMLSDDSARLRASYRRNTSLCASPSTKRAAHV
jgi:hypothetical protein